MRRVARLAAIVAVVVDLAGAWARHRHGMTYLTLPRAALATAIALVPCALAFAALLVHQWRRPVRGMRSAFPAIRLPIAVPRGYLGAAVLGFIGTLAAMGERFAFYIFLAGIALIALALSQARPKRRLSR